MRTASLRHLHCASLSLQLSFTISISILRDLESSSLAMPRLQLITRHPTVSAQSNCHVRVARAVAAPLQLLY
jgi:hypothetical protein